MGVHNMGIYKKVYIGHVETINTNANVNEKVVKSKVVALQLQGFNKNNLPEYKPLRKYSEYYKIITVEPILGFVSDNRINRELKKTGKEEVKILKKVA